MSTSYFTKDVGFCAFFNSAIHFLEVALQKGLVPKIHYFNSPYTDLPEENLWDQYFTLQNLPHPVSGEEVKITVEEIEERRNRKFELHEVFQKHVVIKPSLVQKVDAMFQEYVSCPKIGVHIRNTDRAIDTMYAAPPLEHTINRTLDILRALHHAPRVVIYLASDNIPDAKRFKEVLESVKDTCPPFVVLEDPNTVRSPGQISVHGTHDVGLDIPRPLKAESILTDVMALARCEYLVRVCSNVTGSVAIMNPKQRVLDVSLEDGRFTERWVSNRFP